MQGRSTFEQSAFDQAIGGKSTTPFAQHSNRGGPTFGQTSTRGGGLFKQNTARGGQAFGNNTTRSGNAFARGDSAFGQSRGAGAFGQSSGRGAYGNNEARGGGTFRGNKTLGQSRGRGNSTFGHRGGKGGRGGHTNSAFGGGPVADNNSAFGQSAFGNIVSKKHTSQAFQSKNTALDQALSESTFGSKPSSSPAFQQQTKASAFGQSPFNNTASQTPPAFQQQPQTNAFSGGAFTQSAFGNTVSNNQPTTIVFGNMGLSQPPPQAFQAPTQSVFGNMELIQPTPKAFQQPAQSAFGNMELSQQTPRAFQQPTQSAFGNMESSPQAFQPQPTKSAFGNMELKEKTPNAFTQATKSAFDREFGDVTNESVSTTPFKSNSPFQTTQSTPKSQKLNTNTSFKPNQSHQKKEIKRPGKVTKSTMEAPSSSTMTAADRATRFGSTSKSLQYDQFKERRILERKNAIKSGLIPDPENPTRLEDAIEFRGTCQDKCGEFEMLEREIQNGLDNLEMDAEGNLDPERAVKAYRRSAAGIDQPLPSDVRTPEALALTFDYLVDEVLSEYPLETCHAFIRDRTRSIRQDFTLQNIRDINAVGLHERIARFHILSLHEMCELDEDKFSKQQESEQLRKVLISLMEFYDDLREEGIETSNEAEFRAYNIISRIRDPQVGHQAQDLPLHLFKSQPITRALEFHQLSLRNNEIMESSSRRNKPENIEASPNFYSQFFKLIADKDTSFLLACMLETHFADIRKGALKAMNIAYMFKVGGVQAEDVRSVLAYDSIKQLIEEAHIYGLPIDNSSGVPTIRFGQKHYKNKIAVFVEPLSNPSQKKSLLLVEPKKAGRTFCEIVNGFNSNVTPLPNQNVFAPQSNPISSGSFNFNVQAPSFVSQPVEAKPTVSTDELDEVKLKAAAAEAMAARERKKLEEMEQKKKAEQAAREEAKRCELEKLAQAKQKEQELKEQTIQKEKEQVQLEQQKEQRRKKEHDKKMAAMHLNVVKSQLSKRMLNDILDNIINERANKTVSRVVQRKRLLKKIALPWLSRARTSIKKRTQRTLERKRRWQINMYIVTRNIYVPSDDTIYKAKPSHSTPQGIKERVSHSIMAEKIALDVVDRTQAEKTLWECTDFSLNIYPRIRDKMLDLKQKHLGETFYTKPTWQLMISSPGNASSSSIWLSRKFGLNETFLRRDSHYNHFDITISMVTLKSDIACQTANEVGAILFSLPESKVDKNKAETALYWENNKNRLNKLAADLQKYNPGIRVPFLFTYFPDSSSTESTLLKIPKYLALDKQLIISDYHIMVMNPLTTANRVIEEVNWLSNNTIVTM